MAATLLPWLLLFFTQPLVFALSKKKSNPNSGIRTTQTTTGERRATSKPVASPVPPSASKSGSGEAAAKKTPSKSDWLKRIFGCCFFWKKKEQATKSPVKVPKYEDPRFYDHWVIHEVGCACVKEYREATVPHNLDTMMNCGKGERPRMFFDMISGTDSQYRVRNNTMLENCDTVAFARLKWFPEQNLDEAARQTLVCRKKVAQGQKIPSRDGGGSQPRKRRSRGATSQK